jgi:hypothetical protein
MTEEPEDSVLTARRAPQHQTVTKQTADEPTKAVFRVWGIAFFVSAEAFSGG